MHITIVKISITKYTHVGPVSVSTVYVPVCKYSFTNVTNCSPPSTNIAT